MIDTNHRNNMYSSFMGKGSWKKKLYWSFSKIAYISLSNFIKWNTHSETTLLLVIMLFSIEHHISQDKSLKNYSSILI